MTSNSRIDSKDLDLSDIQLSTLYYGPTYNRLASNGLPILGGWETPPQKTSEIDEFGRRPGKNTRFTPPAGMMFTNMVIAKPGFFGCQCAHTQPEVGASISISDIEIIDVLALSDPDQTIWPRFSLTLANQETKSCFPNNVYKKCWEPVWLGKTEIGQTLYACHMFVDALINNPKEFEVAPKEEFKVPMFHDAAIELLRKLRGLKLSGSFNLSILPSNPKTLIQPNPDNPEEVICKTEGIPYAIDISEEKPNEKLPDEAEDIANIKELNQIFDDFKPVLSVLMPCFYRLEQLFSILCAYHALKDKHVVITDAFRGHTYLKLEKIEDILELEYHEWYCFKLPLVGG